MAWIKKNLVFVVASGVALLLLGVAGWFLFSNMGRDAAIQEELNQELSNWQGLNSGTSFPSQENIDAAKKEQEKFKKFRKEAASVIPVNTPVPKMSDQAFAGFLGNTIADLRNKATAAGVDIPQQYDFTFSAQRKSLNFPAGSIESWIPQLNDIKSICNALFQARVSALDSIQRVAVSVQDAGSADFLTGNVVSNQFGTFTPYQVSFRGFGPELAGALEQFERATNFLVVKSIFVMPSASGLAPSDGGVAAPYIPRAAPAYNAPQRRYSGGKGGNEDLLLGGSPGPAPRQYAPPPTRMRTPAPGAAADTILSEQPLQVTVLLDVVKLNPVQ